MIDILAAIESVAAAAVSLSAEPTPVDQQPRAGLTATAIALAVPSARRPDAAAALIAGLRADPAAAARAHDATLGAAIVWRAVDRAERTGEPVLIAAESGLRAALAYIDLVPAHTLADCAAGDPSRCAALVILDLQARLALGGPSREPGTTA